MLVVAATCGDHADRAERFPHGVRRVKLYTSSRIYDIPPRGAGHWGMVVCPVQRFSRRVWPPCREECTWSSIPPGFPLAQEGELLNPTNEEDRALMQLRKDCTQQAPVASDGLPPFRLPPASNASTGTAGHGTASASDPDETVFVSLGMAALSVGDAVDGTSHVG